MTGKVWEFCYRRPVGTLYIAQITCSWLTEHAAHSSFIGTV